MSRFEYSQCLNWVWVIFKIYKNSVSLFIRTEIYFSLEVKTLCMFTLRCFLKRKIVCFSKSLVTIPVQVTRIFAQKCSTRLERSCRYSDRRVVWIMFRMTEYSFQFHERSEGSENDKRGESSMKLSRPRRDWSCDESNGTLSVLFEQKGVMPFI